MRWLQKLRHEIETIRVLIYRCFFKLFADDEIITDNFVNEISILKTTPIRNKSYTSTQEKKIEKIIESEPILSVFIKLISYNFLRPIEVCRLKVALC